MSKVAELAYDIEQLYIEGRTAKQIARELDCPLYMVEGWIKDNCVADLQQSSEEEIYSPYFGA